MAKRLGAILQASFAFLVLAFPLVSCEVVRGREGMLLPVGRLARDGNKIEVAIDSQPYKAELVADHSGGYWLKLPFSAIRDKHGVQVRFALSKLGSPVHEELASVARWTSPGRLIDSDNPAIVAAAKRMTAGRPGDDAKAGAILAFCQGLRFQPSAGMHQKKASESLAEGSGICVNHARVFVALCRAAGIPARTVSGTLAGMGNDGHHEWAEYYDRRKDWRPVDPTSDSDCASDSKDLKYIDLVYDIESNPIYPFDRGWERDEVALKDGDISVFCADWALQEKDGRMSYSRQDGGKGDPVELEVDYDLAKYRIE
jgi:hypothetical protein